MDGKTKWAVGGEPVGGRDGFAPFQMAEHRRQMSETDDARDAGGTGRTLSRAEPRETATC